jgi:hypothetical protein
MCGIDGVVGGGGGGIGDGLTRIRDLRRICEAGRCQNQPSDGESDDGDCLKKWLGLSALI